LRICHDETCGNFAKTTVTRNGLLLKCKLFAEECKRLIVVIGLTRIGAVSRQTFITQNPL
jgi:hypothetical protein